MVLEEVYGDLALVITEVPPSVEDGFHIPNNAAILDVKESPVSVPTDANDGENTTAVDVDTNELQKMAQGGTTIATGGGIGATHRSAAAPSIATRGGVLATQSSVIAPSIINGGGVVDTARSVVVPSSNCAVQHSSSQFGGGLLQLQDDSGYDTDSTDPDMPGMAEPSDDESDDEDSDQYRRSYKNTAVSRAMRQAAREESCAAIVEEKRPEKPTVPTRSQARRDSKWDDAKFREYKKLADEQCFAKLEKDENGAIIFPDNAVVMRLIEILEFKWKPNPTTGEMVWLECVRAVVDGSMDKREGEDCYAETPSRTVFLAMLSCSTSAGDYVVKSDVVRAYLNAKSIDRNLVAEFPKEIIDLNLGYEKFMSIDKGVYGSKKGALSWQVFFDDIVVGKLGFKKCMLAVSVYTKIVNGKVIRLFRHSDDIALFGQCKEDVDSYCVELSKRIRMAEWVYLNSFLGAEIEYVENLALVRQTGKIEESITKFSDLSSKWNHGLRVRKSPLPANALESDENLSDDMKVFLQPHEVSQFRSIVGSINWIASIRLDIKFALHVIASRAASARVWDLYCAVWLLDFLNYSKAWPLVLGGPVIDICAMSDASLGIMSERRSIKGNFLRTGLISGAILAEVTAIKCAVGTIFDAEVMAASDGVDNLCYGRNLCTELVYDNVGDYPIHLDSESALEWFTSRRPSSRSRHLELKYFRVKHSLQEGVVKGVYVPGPENTADLLTKVSNSRKHEYHAHDILGHKLIAFLSTDYDAGIIVIEASSESI